MGALNVPVLTYRRHRCVLWRRRRKPFRVITPPRACARAPLPPYFDQMASFVRIVLAGAGSFAKMEIRAGDDISDLVERACAKFSHWGVNAGQISLYLVAAGGDDMPPPSAVDSARHLDQIGWSLTRAEISSGAWLVARASSSPASSAASKKFILVVNVEDEYGEIVPKSLDITISTQAQLEKVVKRNGGGNLVLDGTSSSVEEVAEITSGGTYTLIGGQQEAVKRHVTWTQAADKELELRATEAVRDAGEKMYGKLDMSTNTILKNARGEEREFDGLLINTKTAIAVEAKHVAEPKHVTLVLDKATFLLEHAHESNAGNLKGITSVVPVLASSRFGPAMIALCEARGVGVVKPNGSGHTYFPSASPPNLSGRRGFHTLARVLRVLF